MLGNHYLTKRKLLFGILNLCLPTITRWPKFEIPNIWVEFNSRLFLVEREGNDDNNKEEKTGKIEIMMMMGMMLMIVMKMKKQIMVMMVTSKKMKKEKTEEANEQTRHTTIYCLIANRMIFTIFFFLFFCRSLRNYCVEDLIPWINGMRLEHISAWKSCYLITSFFSDSAASLGFLS